MDSIVQAILNRSKLEVTLIKITEPTADSFTMELKTQVTATGPVSSTMSSMTVDLVYAGASFGKLVLPEVRTSSGGFELHIPAQKIQIINMASFKSFVTDLMLKDTLALALRNGDCKIKALGLSSQVKYEKDLEITGMGGPRVKMVRTESLGNGKIRNVMKVENPSPLEMAHGITSFNLVTKGGETVATVRGDLRIERGEFESAAMGEVTSGSKIGVGEGLVLVGAGTDGGSWTDETVRGIMSGFPVTREFVSVMA